MGEEETVDQTVDDAGDGAGAGRRTSAVWQALIGLSAFVLFSYALGVAISGGSDSTSTAAGKPKTQVLGQQFVRDTTTTTLDAPLSGGKVTIRIDRAATTTTRPPRTTTTRPATVTTSPRTTTPPQTPTAAQTVTAPQTPTTTGTLPPRLECGTGSAVGTASVDITPIRATETWTVLGTIAVTNGVSKPIVIDVLTLQIGRELTTTLDAPIGGAAGAVLDPGEVRTFAVDVATDARPVTVHIGTLSYHVAGVPACAVA